MGGIIAILGKSFENARMPHMDFEFYRLKNGVRVMLVPMSGVESVAVGVYVAAGSRDETKENNGVAHFLEHMAFRGTTKYPTRDKTAILEGLGAIQNGWTYSDATSYWAKLPSDMWRVGLELETELAMHPLIRQEDVKTEQGVILEEINRRFDSPDELVGEVFYDLVYGDTPLGRWTLGTKDTIAAMTHEKCANFHLQAKQAGNVVVALAGKMGDIQVVKSQIEEWFGSLPLGKIERVKPVVQPGQAVEIVTKNESAQVQLILGVNTFDVHDPRRFALAVLDRIMGFGMSSRLFKHIRDELGLAYTIHSNYELEMDHGYWAVQAGVKTTNLDQAVQAILQEIGRLTEELVGEEEFKAAIEKVRGPTLFAMENPYNQMNFYANQALWRPEQIYTYTDLLDQIKQVTPENVRQVARDLFRSDNLYLAIVGAVEKSREQQLAKLLKF